MKVILSAYACEPGRGSEPGVGWNMAYEIAKHHQVWVLTSNTHRPAIEAELARHQPPSLNFVYLDPLGWVYDWSSEGKRSQWSVHLHYYLWQIWAYFVARSLHRQFSFDLAHHVTYVKYSSPSFLVFLSIPFIWGPVGGGESAPQALWRDFSFRGKIYESLRMLARFIGEHDPFTRLTARRSVLSLATTKDTAERLHKIGAKKVQVFSQLGLPDEEITYLTQCGMSESSTQHFVSIGRLLHWKGFHLGLRAFAQANLPNTEYWIVGEGPEKERLQHLAFELGISKQVKFWNKLARKETLDKLVGCLALIHPSLHDSGGLVCLEAMAAGYPVICLDLGGPALQVTEETGYKIPAHASEQAVNDLAKTMIHLAKNTEVRQSMGQAGQKRVREVFSWQARGYLLAQTYEEIIGHKFS
ncbi:MAG: glycosyltransferase [Rhizonema sp. PD37]|nr:glycosyltransferase [Rhizonema sp. PD37]